MSGRTIQYLGSLLVMFCLAVSPTYAAVRYTDKDSTGCSTPSDTDYDPVTRACGSGSATVYNTIAGGLTVTTAGDTLYIRTTATPYNETIRQGVQTIPAGTSWANAPLIAGYPGEVPTLRPSSACEIIGLNSTANKYIHFKDLKLDGTNLTQSISFGCYNVSLDGNNNVTFLRLENIEITKSPWNGLLGGCSGCEFINLNVHDNGLAAQQLGYGPGNNGVYFTGTNSLFERGQFHNNNCYGIRVFNSAVFPQANDNIVRYVKAFNNGYGIGNSGASTCGSGGGGLIVADQDNLLYRNLSTGNWKGIEIIQGGGVSDDNRVLHNTISGNTNHGLAINQGLRTVTDTEYKNNHIVGNSPNLLDNGTGSVSGGNRTTGSVTDCTVSTSNFTQKAGSACIDAGTIIADVAYNGNAPDIGAFETFLFAFCAVEATTPTVVNITFTNNVAPPLLPASSITGFSAREDASTKTNSSTTRVGDNQVDLTVTAAFSSGTAIDISISSTNLTDSSLVANTTNQPFVQTVSNQSCTNNVAGAPSFVLTQARYEWH